MRVDIVSDVICPWCFIGKRRLEKALAQRDDVAAEIAWRPFQLNPDMPEEGMPREDYLAAKFGNGRHAGRINHALADAGASIGIEFAFDRIRRTPNTRNAHRLIRFAGREGQANAVVDAIFRAYFLEGRDIGAPATLAEIGAEAGLQQAGMADYLAGEEDREAVLAEDLGARRLGINAVPCFIFAGQYAISGAQEPEFFFPVFDLAKSAAAPAG